MNEYIGKKPYQPEDFLRDNRAAIIAVFPDFFSPDAEPEGLPEDPELQYSHLEDRVLGITAYEPAMQALGRERFAVLPQLQRFQLVKDSLLLVQAIKEANEQVIE